MREGLAALMHEIWGGWANSMLGRCGKGKAGDLIIPRRWVKRWERQVDMDYDALSEEEKNSDQREADKVLALIRSQETGDRCVCPKCGQPHDPKLVSGGLGQESPQDFAKRIEAIPHIPATEPV